MVAHFLFRSAAAAVGLGISAEMEGYEVCQPCSIRSLRETDPRDRKGKRRRRPGVCTLG